MPVTIAEIRELKSYLVGTYHNKRIKEQETDISYYNDTFEVPWIKDMTNIVRTGKAARMIDGPAEHIITNNPQVFRYPSSEKKSKDASDRVAKELNRWVKVLLRQQPQPFKEFAKSLLLEGEGWIYVPHNDSFKKDDKLDLPVNILVPDATVMFLDPEGTDFNGVPHRLIMSFERVAQDVRRVYPEWVWKNQKNQPWTAKIPFMMYWDDEVRYFEADSEPLLYGIDSDDAGIQPNVYKFVPFIHSYSGFGRTSADGDPANLAVGRLRRIRNLLQEQCAIRSVINTLTYKFAYKSIDLLYNAMNGAVPSGDIGETYRRELNSFNIIGVPGVPGKDVILKVSEEQLPDAQLFQHLYNIEKQVDAEDPIGQYSQVIGSSGRQQDIAQTSGLKRYETIVDNTASAFAIALGMGLQMCELKNELYPSGLKEGDIGGYYDCEIKLRADDPIEQDRVRMLGRTLYMDGQIDLETNLVEYQGYTQEEAQRIMAKILVDNVTRNNPIVMQILGNQMAKEIGMEQEYQALQQAGEGPTTPQQNMPQAGTEGGQPRTMNIQSPLGREQTDLSLMQRGVRSSPIG